MYCEEMDAPTTIIRSAEEETQITLLSRTTGVGIPTDRPLFWRALDTMPPSDTPQELALWAELRRQVPEALHNTSPLFREPEPPAPDRGPDDRLQFQEWFALFAPRLGLTMRVSTTLGNWVADYDNAPVERAGWIAGLEERRRRGDPEETIQRLLERVRATAQVPCVNPLDGKIMLSSWAGPSDHRETSYHCILEGDLVMIGLHLFLGIHDREDSIALDLSILDELQGVMARLPERRMQMMHDYGMDKIRLRNPRGGWSAFDKRDNWSWGKVERIFMLLRPSQKYGTVRERVERGASIDPHGHWILCVYERRDNVVHIYDSREHLVDWQRVEVLKVIRNMLTGFGLFSAGLSLPGRMPEGIEGAGMAEPIPRVRIAYSQEADWECGHFVIHQTRIILRRGSHRGDVLWDEWASVNTKANWRRLDLRRDTQNHREVTAPQREHSRTLMAQTMADFREFVEARARAGLWNIMRPG